MGDSADYSPVILEGQQHQDDELLEKRPPLDERDLSGHGSEVVMELLQRFKVRDVMKRKILSVTRETPLREAQRIMRGNHISGVAVAANEPRVEGENKVGRIIMPGSYFTSSIT